MTTCIRWNHETGQIRQKMINLMSKVANYGLIILTGTMRQYSAKSSMERKCKSLHKKSRLILLLTQNQSEDKAFPRGRQCCEY